MPQNLNQMGVWGATIGSYNTSDTNYFPSAGGLGDQSFYVDTNSVMAPGSQVITGIALIAKGNRIALAIWCVSPSDGTGGQWVLADSSNDDDYFGPCNEYNVDTNPVFAPPGQVLRGAQLYAKGNRMALKIYCTDLEGANASWIADKEGMNDNYFPNQGGMEDVYADTNPALLGSTGQAVGAGLWLNFNRVAPYLINATAGEFPT